MHNIVLLVFIVQFGAQMWRLINSRHNDFYPIVTVAHSMDNRLMHFGISGGLRESWHLLHIADLAKIDSVAWYFAAVNYSHEVPWKFSKKNQNAASKISKSGWSKTHEFSLVPRGGRIQDVLKSSIFDKGSFVSPFGLYLLIGVLICEKCVFLAHRESSIRNIRL